MRLLNATDKKTDKLAQYGLLGQSVSVDDQLVKPGASIDVKDADKARVEAEHPHLFATGALVWEETPAAPTADAPKTEAPKNAIVDMAAKGSKKAG